MAGKVISIEIGYSLTRVCEVDYKSKTHKVYGYFTMPTPEGMINDGILNLNETFVTDLKETLAEHRMKSKQVVFTLTSTKIASREVTFCERKPDHGCCKCQCVGLFPGGLKPVSACVQHAWCDRKSEVRAAV